VTRLVDVLASIVGDRACLHRPEELLVYECDGLTLNTGRPEAVVFPRSADEVVGIVKACRELGATFVPRGAGTGLSGGAVGGEGSVVIECSRMDRILELDAENRFAVVEPGVINAEVSKVAAAHGLFYAPDPSSQFACTIGGNIAENSGGPHTLKYGTTTNHVLAVDLVLPDGEQLKLGSATGWSTGYDLVGAVVGSEGTLGVVTAATVRLERIPEGVETLLVIFPDVVTACRTVTGIIGAGMVPAALEIVDQRTIAAVEDSVYAAGLPRDAGAVLIVELDGSRAGLPAHVAKVRAIAKAEGATRLEVARDDAERNRFWRARKGAFGAMGRLAPDLYVHDAVVPRARLPEVLEKVCAIGDRYGLKASMPAASYPASTESAARSETTWDCSSARPISTPCTACGEPSIPTGSATRARSFLRRVSASRQTRRRVATTAFPWTHDSGGDPLGSRGRAGPGDVSGARAPGRGRDSGGGDALAARCRRTHALSRADGPGRRGCTPGGRRQPPGNRKPAVARRLAVSLDPQTLRHARVRSGRGGVPRGGGNAALGGARRRASRGVGASAGCDR
jgi:glycolate oxidase subunit GlcD